MIESNYRIDLINADYHVFFWHGGYRSLFADNEDLILAIARTLTVHDHNVSNANITQDTLTTAGWVNASGVITIPPT